MGGGWYTVRINGGGFLVLLGLGAAVVLLSTLCVGRWRIRKVYYGGGVGRGKLTPAHGSENAPQSSRMSYAKAVNVTLLYISFELRCLFSSVVAWKGEQLADMYRIVQVGVIPTCLCS